MAHSHTQTNLFIPQLHGNNPHFEMAPTKSESDHIQLLLSIMEETEGKTDWNAVAKKTGLYKGGKFVYV